MNIKFKKPFIAFKVVYERASNISKWSMIDYVVLFLKSGSILLWVSGDSGDYVYRIFQQTDIKTWCWWQTKSQVKTKVLFWMLRSLATSGSRNFVRNFHKNTWQWKYQEIKQIVHTTLIDNIFSTKYFARLTNVTEGDL